MLYKHTTSGNLYRVLYEGFYEPTLERVTVYMSVTKGTVWVRPTDVFHELIHIKDHVWLPRFQEVEDELHEIK